MVLRTLHIAIVSRVIRRMCTPKNVKQLQCSLLRYPFRCAVAEILLPRAFARLW